MRSKLPSLKRQTSIHRFKDGMELQIKPNTHVRTVSHCICQQRAALTTDVLTGQTRIPLCSPFLPPLQFLRRRLTGDAENTYTAFQLGIVKYYSQVNPGKGRIPAHVE